MNTRIIAVDFDGTLCESKWPDIGAPNLGLIYHLMRLRHCGAKLILWTCRRGDRLAEAVVWCAKHGLEFDAVNENLQEVIDELGGDTRKIFAHEYVDDKSCTEFKLPFSERISQETIMKLETLFGFTFHDWQIKYLQTTNPALLEQGRGTGKTFIYTLELLLGAHDPFEVRDIKTIRKLSDAPSGTNYAYPERFFRPTLVQINDTLRKAGFATNLIDPWHGDKYIDDKTSYFTTQDAQIVEEFLTKTQAVMEFSEIQAIVKMQYDLYQHFMNNAPKRPTNTYKGENTQ
jgi:hypothetical protein